MDLRGTLTSDRLREVFQKLAKNKAIGTLTVTDGPVTKYIYFARAGVRLLSSGQRRLRLGDILVAQGRITGDQLQAILGRQQETGEMIGKILTDWGLVTEDEIDDAVKSQIEEEIYDLFTLEEAEFEFTEGAPPPELFDPDQRATRLTFDVDSLVEEAARRAAELEELRQLIPGDRTVFQRTGATELSFSEHEEAAATATVIDLVDGMRTVGEICDASALSRFDTYRSLAGLVVAGRIAPVGEHGMGGPTRAQRLAHEETVRDTIEECESELLTNPNDPGLRMRLAEAFESQGDDAQALTHWNLAAKAGLKTGRLDDALHATQQALAIDPGNLEAHERLLRIRVERREPDEAMGHAERLATLYTDNGQTEKLRDMYRLLSHVAPDDLDVRRKLVNVYLDLDDTEGALGEYEAMAKIALKQKNQAALEEIYVKATRLAPGRADVQKRFRGLGVGGGPTGATFKARKGGFKRLVGRLLAASVMMALAGGAVWHEFTQRRAAAPLWEAATLAERGAESAADDKLDAKAALIGKAVNNLQRIADAHPLTIFTWSEVSPKLKKLRAEQDRLAEAAEAQRNAVRAQWKAKHDRANLLWEEGDIAGAVTIYEELTRLDEKEFGAFVKNARDKIRTVKETAEQAAAKLQEVKDLAEAGQIAQARAAARDLIKTFPGTDASAAVQFPIRVKSLPPGATVWREGAKIGATPMTFWLTRAQAEDRDFGIKLQIKHTGYETRTILAAIDDLGDSTDDQDGNYLVRLKKKALFKIDLGGAVESQPFVRNGWIYGGSRADRGEVWAVDLSQVDPADAQTWRATWRYDVPGAFTTAVMAPVVCDDDGLLYACTLDGTVLALRGESDRQRGELLWSFPGRGRGLGQIYAAPSLFEQGLVVCAYKGSSGQVVQIDRNSPRQARGRAPITSIGAVESAPARWKNHWIFAARAKNGADPRGRVVAYNPDGASQTEVWVDVRLRGSPAVEGDWCVVGDREGNLYLLDMRPNDDGAPRMAQVHKVPLGSAIAVSPVLRDGVAYVATGEGTLAAFAIQEGKLVKKWDRALGHKITTGPVLHQNTLYCGTRGDAEGGTVVAVNAFNAELEWEFRTAKPVNCLPVVHDGVVYVGADDGVLYALAER